MTSATANCEQPVYSVLGSDPDLGELVDLFVEEMPERIARLIDQYQRGDWDQLGRTAHQLKGAAGSYGFHQLTPLAARLESHVRGRAALEQIHESLEQLAELCRRVRGGAG